MAALIDGPRLPAKSRTTKQLVVFLHGYGADGNDLIASLSNGRVSCPMPPSPPPMRPNPASSRREDGNGFR